MSKILLALYTKVVAGNNRGAQRPNYNNQRSFEERDPESHDRDSFPGFTMLNPWMALLPIGYNRTSESGHTVTNHKDIRNGAR